MATQTTYEVTRLPGAPRRRAGREWPEGETVTVALSVEEAAAIALDPGYTLVVAAEDPTPPTPRAKRAKA